jgi:hypothetical protein
MRIAEANLLVGWIAMFGGVVSGALIGLHFHKQDWMGGYGSFRRRLTRLGHISFFGLGFLNVLFGLSLKVLALPSVHVQVASLGFIAGAVLMPLCCFLAAWRPQLRHLFPLPVASVFAGIVAMLLGWPSA